MQVKHETFKQIAEETVTHARGSFVRKIGTVEIVFNKKEFTVNARKIDSTIYLQGFVGKYKTSSKQWPATVASEIVENKERVTVDFGRDDRCGKFRKLDCIFYQPE